MSSFIVAVVYSFLAGVCLGFWVCNKQKEKEEVILKQSVKLTAEDILESVKKAHPELKISDDAKVFNSDDEDNLEDFNDDCPVVIEWENPS